MTGLPRRPLTRADLDTMPDDGHRYELIDGALIVTPAPHPQHQVILARLLVTLSAAAPAGTLVLQAPLDVPLAEDTVIQPDLVVYRRDDVRTRDVPVPPLAVEVLSPSTRSIDLLLKKAKLERAGCPSYWIVDPEIPRLIAWELRNGAYVEVADVSGDDAYEATLPFPCRIVPAELIA